MRLPRYVSVAIAKYGYARHPFAIATLYKGVWYVSRTDGYTRLQKFVFATESKAEVRAVLIRWKKGDFR